MVINTSAIIAILRGEPESDCFAYALAKQTGEPLLYKGDDFSRTDIAASLPVG